MKTVCQSCQVIFEVQQSSDLKSRPPVECHKCRLGKFEFNSEGSKQLDGAPSGRVLGGTPRYHRTKRN